MNTNQTVNIVREQFTMKFHTQHISEV